MAVIALSQETQGRSESIPFIRMVEMRGNFSNTFMFSFPFQFVSKLFYGVSRFFNKYRFAVQASKEGAMSICLKPLRMSGSCCSNEFHMDSARALDLFTILAPANVEIHISDAWNGAVSNYSPFIRQTRG